MPSIVDRRRRRRSSPVLPLPLLLYRYRRSSLSSPLIVAAVDRRRLRALPELVADVLIIVMLELMYLAQKSCNRSISVVRGPILSPKRGVSVGI